MQTSESTAVSRATVQPGDYGVILVHVALDPGSERRVQVAAALASKMGARLIGLGAGDLAPFPMAYPVAGMAADWIVALQAQVEQDLKAAEAVFQHAAVGAETEWRALRTHAQRGLQIMARAADLLVLGPRERGGEPGGLEPADVIMSAGRPVLIVPETAAGLAVDSVLIAWKDTRECRRAVADALPLLRHAKSVLVHAVVERGGEGAVQPGIDDLLANLERHGIDAVPLVTTASAIDVMIELQRVATLHRADLIVAGAFGHSRLREWALGGVTDELIADPRRLVLLSR